MNKKRRIGICGLCSALMALGAWVCFPSPTGVPLTVQTFFVALGAFVLGWRDGTIALAVYLALGAAGMPVFSSYQGGIQVFVSPTGGFLWGFLPLTILCGIATDKRDAFAISMGILGMIVCHTLGILQFCLVTDAGVATALTGVSLPYLIKDVACVVLAFFVAKPVRKAISTLG